MTVLNPQTMKPTPWDGETMGEIMFRGNITMKGYLKNPAATAKAFEGGWFHTGDLAVMQPDGYAKIRDRSKDIIISGGENISSIEVEETLYRHPAVLSVAVVAQPDETWGETPCAFIELKPGASVTAEEQRDFCRQHMSPYNVPKAFVIRDDQSVDSRDPITDADHWVDIQLRHTVAMISDEAGHVADHLRQAIQVHARHSAKSLQQFYAL